MHVAIGGDTVADFDSCDILPGFNNLDSSIRQGNHVFLDCRAVWVAQHGLVAEF